ncbi:hypothetical protein ES706_00044 [subsurface metagenome]
MMPKWRNIQAEFGYKELGEILANLNRKMLQHEKHRGVTTK